MLVDKKSKFNFSSVVISICGEEVNIEPTSFKLKGTSSKEYELTLKMTGEDYNKISDEVSRVIENNLRK